MTPNHSDPKLTIAAGCSGNGERTYSATTPVRVPEDDDLVVRLDEARVYVGPFLAAVGLSGGLLTAQSGKVYGGAVKAIEALLRTQAENAKRIADLEAAGETISRIAEHYADEGGLCLDGTPAMKRLRAILKSPTP